MNSRKREKIEGVFAAVLAAREESGFSSASTINITSFCEGDDEVRSEVQSLLRHLAEAGADDSPDTRFLDPAELHGDHGSGLGVGDAMLREWGGEAIGQRVDGFTIIGKLGEGGMGVVYVAEQQNPRRTVALKVIRRAMATASTIKRFEREAQLLGRLNHPGIAQIYAAGIADIVAGAGQHVRTPYIAMELVEGPSIQKYAEQNGRDPQRLLELIAQVCDAIQHAHQRGVIHRDLKPANILVAGESPKVKVLDFGVARPVGEKLDIEEITQLTAHGHLIGTLSYMAPEQLSSKDELDTRCDVYALGAVLYHLLTGRYAIDISDCGIPDAARRIAENDPASLSESGRAFPADLETIVAKALQKDVSRRYQSPGDLARDLRQYLAGEPIEAKRDSLLYVMRRQAKRYRYLALAAILILLGILFFAIYAREQAHREALARSDADASRVRADKSAARLAEELAASRVEQGRLLGQAGDVVSGERMLWDEYLAHPDSHHARGALWELYSHTACLRSIVAHNENTWAVSVDPTADRFASAGSDGYVRLWSIPDGAKLGEIKTDLGIVHGVRFAPDGKSLVAAGENGAAIFDASTAQLLRRLGDFDLRSLNAVDITRDGQLIATGGEDGVIKLFRFSDGTLLGQISAFAVYQPVGARVLRFDTSGRRLAAGFDNGQVRIWELQTQGNAITAISGPAIEGPTQNGITGISFSPDGALVACGSTDRSVYLLDAHSGAPIASWDTHNGTARSVSFSPDGTKIAVIGYFHVLIFDAATHQLWTPAGAGFMGSNGGLSAEFSNDGQYLITSGGAGAVHVWELADDAGAITFRSKSGIQARSISTAAVGNQVFMAVAHSDGTTILRSRQTNAPDWNERVQLHTKGATAVALAPDFSQILVARPDGAICVFDAASGEQIQELSGHSGNVNDIRITPDGNTLASCGSDWTLRLWRRTGVGTRATWEAGPIQKRENELLGTAISRDGKLLLATERRLNVGFWSLPDGRFIGVLRPDTPVWKPAISPDGRWIGVGLWDRSIEMFSVSSLGSTSQTMTNLNGVHAVTHLIGHSQLISAQAFNADSTLLASTSADGLVKIWDVASIASARGDAIEQSRHCLVTLVAHAGEALVVTFLPEPLNNCVAAGYRDGSVRIWDLRHFDRHIEGQREYQIRLRRARPAISFADRALP